MAITLPKFRPRLLAFDMDGTLLDPKHKLTARTIAALQSLTKSGIPYVVATGRHIRDVHPFVPGLPDCSRLIGCNGGAIWNAEKKLLEFADRMAAQSIAELLPECRRHACAVFTSYDDGQVYGLEGGEVAKEHQRRVSIFQFAQMSLEEMVTRSAGPQPYKMSFMGTHEALEKLSALVPKAGKNHGSELKTAFGLPVLLDVQPVGTSKAAALIRVCQDMGIAADQVISVGDGMNDEEMIRWAGFSYAMGNANPELKKLARAELPSNADDGVAQLLEALLASGK